MLYGGGGASSSMISVGPCARQWLVLVAVVWFLHSSMAVERWVWDNKTFCHEGPHNVSSFKTTTTTAAPETFRVRWKTTASADEDIVVEVYRAWAPIGVDRFYRLILDNYYNCAAFFRVVPGTKKQ